MKERLEIFREIQIKTSFYINETDTQQKNYNWPRGTWKNAPKWGDENQSNEVLSHITESSIHRKEQEQSVMS